jgi:hypothetical protein
MEVLHRKCAGLDVHKDSVVACARTPQSQESCRLHLSAIQKWSGSANQNGSRSARGSGWAANQNGPASA